MAAVQRSASGPPCSALARAAHEPMPGTAPEADVWIAVEHPAGWGEASLARSAAGVRVIMARGPRRASAGVAADEEVPGQPGVRVWVAHVGPDPQLRVGRVADPQEVAGWDLAAVAAGSLRRWGAAQHQPLLMVCANGRRDRCCGREGRRLAEALWAGPERAHVLTCTHLGGHRFAPTALVLPGGAVHGRLDPSSASDLLTAARDGQTPAASLRGFSHLPAPAQVADVFARTSCGHRVATALPVRILPQQTPGRLLAQVQVPGPAGDQRCLDVRLRQVQAPTVLSCGLAAAPTARWVVG